MEQKLAKVWPDWKTVRHIGEGSFGKVYEIVRKNFGIEEHCALKVISIPSSQAELQSMRNEGMDDASATAYYRGLVEEFIQEIALMSKLKGNINIVGYEDYAVVEHEGEIGWDIFIRMELLTALPNYIRENNFTATDVVKLAVDVCSALEICHAQRIIHRDIKSDNIFISQSGDFKLGDFGVARTIEKTVSGLSKKGTYTYMAPEVYKGEAYGMSADLYSLGIVMYKMLNHNREPFLPPYPQVISFADKNNALVQRLRGDSFGPPQNASRELSEIILKACAYSAAARFASATAMKNALLSIMRETSQSTVLLGSHLSQNKTNSQSASAPVQNREYTPQAAQANELPPVSNRQQEAIEAGATVALDFNSPVLQNIAPEPAPFFEPIPEEATESQNISDRQTHDGNKTKIQFEVDDQNSNILLHHQEYAQDRVADYTFNSDNTPKQQTEPLYKAPTAQPQMNNSPQRPDYSKYAEAAQAQQTKGKGKSKVDTTIKVIGWIGIVFSIITAFFILPYVGGILKVLLLVGAVLLFASQLLLTLDLAPTAMSIIMLVSSLCTLSVLNLLASVLCLKSTFGKSKL